MRFVMKILFQIRFSIKVVKSHELTMLDKMAKVLFAEMPQKRGIIIGSAWRNKNQYANAIKGLEPEVVKAVEKVLDQVGFGVRCKGKIRNDKGDLEDMTGKDLLTLKFGDSLLLNPNNRKREGKKDPDFIVFAYPDEEKK